MIRSTGIILAALVTGTHPAASDAATRRPSAMSMADLVIRAIPLVPGPSSDVEALLDAPAGSQPTERGWRHAPIDYQTSDGLLLHVTLTSDWENTKAPDVVRLSAAVDAAQCVDAAKIRDNLAAAEKLEWTTLGGNDGWKTSVQGKFLAISTRTGRCLASVIVDIRPQPRPMQPARPLRIGPSGRPEPVPVPGH